MARLRSFFGLTARDMVWEGLMGFLVGIFALPLLNSANFALTSAEKYAVTALAAVAVFFGTLAIRILERYSPAAHQFVRFLAVGSLNALIDFSVLNFFILLSGAALGFYFSVWKALSFIVANSNSYFWNKFWTFGSNGHSAKEMTRFFGVSIGGLLLNVGVASLVLNLADFDTSPTVAANIAAVCGAFAGLTWNFLGYKMFVFARKG